MEIQRFYIGQRVKWIDPGINDYEPEDREEILDRVFIITDICGDEEDEDRQIYICEENGHSEAEVWEHELIAI